MTKSKWDSIELGEVTTIFCPSAKLAKISSSVIKHYSKDKKYKCIYVTVSKTWNALNKMFDKIGANIDNIFYIDCATPLIAGINDVSRTKNAIFVHPSHLTNLMITIGKLTKNNDNEKTVLIFDALSTLIIYNNEDIISKFMHVLSTKIRNSDIDSVIFTIEEETDPKLRARIMQLSDKTLKV